MIKSTELITVEIVDNKMKTIIVHPPCRKCGKDLRAYHFDLPPLEDGTIDKTTVAFQCPNDNNIEIITVTDMENELKKLDNILKS